MQEKVAMTGKLLKDFLKGRIYNGKLSVPHEKNLQIPTKMLEFEQDGITCAVLKQEDMSMAKEYMVNYFYKTAVVPKALRLTEMIGKHPYMEQELELMTKPNVCQVFHEAKTGELAAVVLNCPWTVDRSYDPFPVSAVEWLNTAGQIANEEASNDFEAYAIFRNYHLLLTYHLYQGDASKQAGKKLILFSGMMHTEVKFRHRQLSMKLTQNDIDFLPPHIFVGYQVTFPGVRTLMSKHFGGKIQEIQYIPYNELTVRIGNTEIFGGLKDKEGITIQGTIC